MQRLVEERWSDFVLRTTGKNHGDNPRIWGKSTYRQEMLLTDCEAFEFLSYSVKHWAIPAFPIVVSKGFPIVNFDRSALTKCRIRV
jgi:hypothetical protein